MLAMNISNLFFGRFSRFWTSKHNETFLQHFFIGFVFQKWGDIRKVVPSLHLSFHFRPQFWVVHKICQTWKLGINFQNVGSKRSFGVNIGCPKKIFFMFEGFSRVYVSSKFSPILKSFLAFFFMWFFFMLFYF
jgi:hypothetical protein